MPEDAAAAAAAAPLWHTLAASITAGIIGRVACHPLDTCKARLQASSKATMSAKFRSLPEVLRGTWAAEGLSGFYRGIGVSVVGAAPATCVYLTAYEQSKAFVERTALVAQFPAVGHLACGFWAETLSCVVFVPVDVLKERLQIQRSYAGANYRGSWDALRTVLRYEGLGGLYRGYLVTLGSFGPYSALMFAFYEGFKDGARRLRRPATADLPFRDNLGAGALAAGLAALLTSPLDLVKLRLQIQRRKFSATDLATEYDYHYRGFVDAVRSMARAEGWRSFMKGAESRMLYSAFVSAITLASFEWLKVRLAAVTATAP